jgi:putative addiction module killer protein
MIELRYFRGRDGVCPFEDWFRDLDAQAAAKISVGLVRVEQGNLANVKGVGEGVLEYRIDWGPGYRVYFGRDGEYLVVLLTGGTKKRQQRDIETAKKLWRDYKVQRPKPQSWRPTKMAATKSFKGLVQARIASDRVFAVALLREGIETMLAGDVDTGKSILRDYIKATVGFERLGKATATPAKSLIRMFGTRGNPQARNLFGVIGYLQKQAGVALRVAAGPR